MGEVQPLAELDWPILRAASVCVDAVFGTGLSRPVPPAVWGSLVMAQESGAQLVAVDILSGICADSGRILSDSGYTDFPAALTVTFERAKTGHVLADGAVLSGRLQVVPIGLDRQMDALLSGPQADRVVDATRPSLSLIEKTQGHKYSHGHALILSGPTGRGGAARLAARGALRIGAGLVTLGCPPDAIPENAARLDAVMLRGVVDGLALEEALADPRINALCIGPGLGVDARGREVVAVALKCRSEARPTGADVGRASDRQTTTTLVLDADALTILSQDPDLFAALHERCILTPHAGEFARLFPDIAAKLAAPATSGPAYSKLDATRDAAARAGCTVLFKGPDTVIANPSGRAAINAAHDDRAAPWLATAGSGDVLAGFITGLLARGFPLFDAAATGAWLHVECARSFGPGLIAEDLPEELPKVFRALGL
jgi:hydroxyethylthiazole kinase-like uncharacterized protein yjeF